MRLTLGVLWLFSGVIWIYRATREEADPKALASIFAKPETQTAKARAWKMRLGFIYVMIAGLYLLFAIFSYRH